jgi:hypothetical protein
MLDNLADLKRAFIALLAHGGPLVHIVHAQRAALRSDRASAPQGA